MEANTDLTNFWLAWYHTCAIRLCTEQNRRELVKACAGDAELLASIDDVVALADDVIKSTNAEFCRHLCVPHGARRSIYENEAFRWKEGNGAGSAFELMEGYLYAKGTINGRAFKDYLFEDIAKRRGGINRNLYGYIQSILASMAKESFGENIYEAVKDENGVDIPPRNISLDGKTLARPESSPDENIEASEVIEFFNRYIEKTGAEWDDDKWIVLFCILNMLRVGAEKVQPLFSKSHDTINNYCKAMRAELLHVLRENFEDRAIAIALNGAVQRVLDEKMEKMRCFSRLKELVEENRKSTGK